MNIDKILCRMLEGAAVSTEDRAAVVTHVRTRLEAGEQGDDLPIAMEALGVDYDAAVEAVQAANPAAAVALLATVEA